MTAPAIYSALTRPGPMSPISIDVTSAGSRVLYELAGHRLIIRRTPSSAAEINVRLNTAANEGWNLREGEGFEHYAFERLFLTWSAGEANEKIELAYGGNVSEADPLLANILTARSAQDVDVQNFPDGFDVNNWPVTQQVSIAGTLPVSIAAGLSIVEPVWDLDAIPAGWEPFTAHYSTTNDIFIDVHSPAAGDVYEIQQMVLSTNASGAGESGLLIKNISDDPLFECDITGGCSPMRFKNLHFPSGTYIDLKEGGNSGRVHLILQGYKWNEL